MQLIVDGEIEQTDPCAQHLLELEYFITRNYQYDRQLLKACRADMNVSHLNLQEYQIHTEI